MCGSPSRRPDTCPTWSTLCASVEWFFQWLTCAKRGELIKQTLYLSVSWVKVKCSNLILIMSCQLLNYKSRPYDCNMKIKLYLMFLTVTIPGWSTPWWPVSSCTRIVWFFSLIELLAVFLTTLSWYWPLACCIDAPRSLPLRSLCVWLPVYGPAALHQPQGLSYSWCK